MPGMSLRQRDDVTAVPVTSEAATGAVGTRGLLHDLTHQLMTLSLLAEAVRADDALTGETRRRIELVQNEMFRAMDMITDHIAAGSSEAAAESDVTDVRDLAGQIAALAEIVYGARVRLLPGPPVSLGRSPALLWRVLSNVIDNAARAAGPDGVVEVSIRHEIDTVIDVFDNGPGFGSGPAGVDGLGLAVVQQLLDTTDGRLEVADRGVDGTRVRVVFRLERERVVVPLARTGTWH
jgi:signal transduction histidine kinase